MPLVWCSTKVIRKFDVFFVDGNEGWVILWPAGLVDMDLDPMIKRSQWKRNPNWKNLGKLQRASCNVNVREGHFPFIFSRIKSNFYNLHVFDKGDETTITTTRRISRFLLRVETICFDQITLGGGEKTTFI